MRHENPKFKNFLRLPEPIPNVPGDLVPTPLKEIYPEIFVYEEFLPEHLEFKYLKHLDAMTVWNFHGNYDQEDHSDKWWNNRLSLDFMLFEMTQKATNLMTPEFMIFQHQNVFRIQSGESSPLHNSSNSPYSKHEYNLAIYMGDFTGGELVFPELGFKYAPKRRDLVIFKADPKYSHYVSEVTSGTRYTWIDFAFRHPGYVAM